MKQEASTESPNGSTQSPVITSNVEVGFEDVECSLSMEAQASEVPSKAIPASDNVGNGPLEDDGNDSKDNFRIVKEDDVNVGLKKLSEKLCAALVNVSAKEDLVKQHAKVAEEAITGTANVMNDCYSFLMLHLSSTHLWPWNNIMWFSLKIHSSAF